MSHTQPLAIWNNGPRSGLAVDLSAFFRNEPGAEGRVGAFNRLVDGVPTLRDVELFRAQLRVIANSDTRSRTNRTQRAADLLGRFKAATAAEGADMVSMRDAAEQSRNDASELAQPAARVAMQDGGQFYELRRGKLLADYGDTGRSDDAEQARARFLRVFPEWRMATPAELGHADKPAARDAGPNASAQAQAILDADARDGIKLETTTAETIAALFRNGSLDARKPYADANVAAAKLVNLKRLVCAGLESERATARAVDAMRAERDEARAILARIMRAELTDNNGAVMGEATLCRSFLLAGFRALGKAAADLLGPACFERVANMK